MSRKIIFVDFRKKIRDKEIQEIQDEIARDYNKGYEYVMSAPVKKRHQKLALRFNELQNEQLQMDNLFLSNFFDEEED